MRATEQLSKAYLGVIGVDSADALRLRLGEILHSLLRDEFVLHEERLIRRVHPLERVDRIGLGRE
jgi:hypothetical protein